MLRLATVSASGEPHVAPVWYMRRGGRLYVGTGSRTVKARNVAATGRAAYCIDVGARSPGIRGVSGSGPARLVTGPEAEALAREILLRYYGSLDEPAARELLAQTDCVIEVEEGRTASWRY